MWYENESSRNMTTIPLQQLGDKQNNFGVDIANEKQTAVNENQMPVNEKQTSAINGSRNNSEKHRADVERPNGNERKMPLHKYRTRTNAEWQKAFGSKLPRESVQRMDYILVYKKPSPTMNGNVSRDDEFEVQSRKKFMDAMEAEGIDILTEEIGENVYLKLHTPFWRLCKEAEREGLKMPVKDLKTDGDDEDKRCNCWYSFQAKYLETDHQDDFISGPFKTDRIGMFKDGDNADLFFRPALRSLMTYWILVNIDIGKAEDKESFSFKGRGKDALAKQGLLYMLHKHFFTDAFPVHDMTTKDPIIENEHIKLVAMYGSSADIKDPVEPWLSLPDTRHRLGDAWAKFYKYQPLWMIRDYFGEKIGLYFAWCGTFIMTLWIPMLFGLAVFGYGLFLSISRRIRLREQWTNVTNDKAENLVEQSIAIVKESFDNDVTPYFAIAISLWGTIFLEFWKRGNATLAYEWDVNSFETTEPDRPSYEASHRMRDPVTGEMVKYSPVIKQTMKYSVSFVTIIFMVCLVFIAAAAIIVYRIVLTVDYCIQMTPSQCLLATTVASSLLNALAILVLGKIYEVLAVKLTDWENHRTQTQYDDSLIVKLFAFQFANSYTSLYYIAFFRGRAFQNGVFGLGTQYRDTCGDDVTSSCMPMLSFQVLVLMLTKPLPKFVKDVLLPGLKWLWHSNLKRLCQSICCCCQQNQISSTERQSFSIPTFLEREYQKPDVGDFTLTEYTEKVIIYGFLMLFAASLPIAPLIALLTLLIDVRIDAKRLLWLNRRPVAFIAQDIGTWYTILNFLNVVGVVSNACLIAFTSSWGNKYNTIGKLLIIIGFEHIVFAVKFLIDVFIPDVPASVELAQRREIYVTQKILDVYTEETKEMNGSAVGKSRRKSMENSTKADEEDDPEIRSILKTPEATTRPRLNINSKGYSGESWDSSPELDTKNVNTLRGSNENSAAT